MYGLQEARRRVSELQCMWLSHRHADHHVGVPLVLSTRRQMLGDDAPPLPVFGPWPLRRVLSACNKIEPLAYQWIDHYGLCPQEQAEARGLMYFWTQAAKCEYRESVLKSVLEVCRTLPCSFSWDSCCLALADRSLQPLMGSTTRNTATAQ
jgi:ribonuclease BN (tRNA processing enzyme)